MTRVPLGRAHTLASMIADELWNAGVRAASISPVGGLRRHAATVREVALLAVTRDGSPDDLLAAFGALPAVGHILARAPGSAMAETERGPLTLYVTDPPAAAPLLVALTGSGDHVRLLAEIAASRGLQFAGGRLLDSAGTTVPCESEEEFYGRLGLPFIPPELREGGDEVEAARDGRLPALLSSLHVRGDLHMHTTWSDGRHTVEEMVSASQELGYEYIAITDHSQSAWSSHKLALDDIPRQRDEIRAAGARHPQIQVLHGVEVDILPDGRLDFDDRVLAGFDIVLASLHNHAGHTPAALTQRYLHAIDSPYVDIITHPANRSPGVSPGYAVDFDRIFAAAVTSGTALEVDGAPGHLDMDGALARRAAAAGVTIVVDSDSHRRSALARQMQFGVATARRGWLEPRHVLNTRGVAEIRRFVTRQRQRA